MGWLHPFRDRRRRTLAAAPLPAVWSEIVDRNVPYCRALPADERRRLEGLIQVFLAEKRFEGCGGLEITDEIRVTVAAQACLLLLNLQHDYYGRLASILVYPGLIAFRPEERGVAGSVSMEERPVSGLSSSLGAVVLSWPDTVHGTRRPEDGSNVVLHEFAHQLDHLDGAMDGAPPLATAALYREWARVLTAEYDQLRRRTNEGLPTLIGEYAATKPVEFFAVVTELFFERPHELREQHPALYDEFRKYYRQDPVERIPR